MPVADGRICITHERIRQIREKRECGMMDAKKIATLEVINVLIDCATSVDDLKPILRALASKPG